jgi:micrococcal nuclease
MRKLDESPKPRGHHAGRVALALLSLLAAPAGPAAADWLAFTTGEEQATEGPWTVKGRQVVFTTAGGHLSAVRAEDVDIAASRFLTAQKQLRPNAKAAQAAPLGSTPAPAGPCAQARVLGTSDGETLKVEINGKAEEVRLACADAPETVHPGKPVQRFGELAWAFTGTAAEGKTVCVADDPKQKQLDRYGRRAVYVTLPDGRDLGAALIAAGFGVTWHTSSCTRVATYDALERVARQNVVGLWGPLPSAEEEAQRQQQQLLMTAVGTGKGTFSIAGTPVSSKPSDRSDPKTKAEREARIKEFAKSGAVDKPGAPKPPTPR